MTTTDPNLVMEATEGFACDIDGERFIVNRKNTRVAASHPLVQRYPGYFTPVEDNLSFRIEAATDDPGEARGFEAATSEPGEVRNRAPAAVPEPVKAPAAKEPAAASAASGRSRRER